MRNQEKKDGTVFLYDITKTIYLISQNHFDFVIYIKKNDFVISKNGISDIKNSIL